MPATVLVGMQWGDEGKAKVLDALADETDIVVRYQGGANAGHTVVVGKERYAFHLVPSGILRDNKVCVIANGCVVDPIELVKEINELRARGVKIDCTNLLLSDRAQLVMPYHRIVDQLSEKKKETSGAGKIGTTGRGIGPAYVDKVARSGIRVIDLLRPTYLADRVRHRLTELNPILTAVYGHAPLDADKVADEVINAAQPLKTLIADTAAFINDALAHGKRLLFEGAQGSLLDIDHGTYPYVTSSNATAGGAATGSGCSPKRIETALGVAKAYTTRVGAGPFPTELTDAQGDAIRERGGEFGTTTGRPRRCGWFDAVGVNYATEVSGVDAIALTKLDVLTGEKELKLCVKYTVDGRELTRFPADIHAVEKAVPTYETMPGWGESLEDIRQYEKLPRAARDYVERIEKLVGIPVRYIGVGKSRDALIEKK
ncbi:MAG: adenylosuccinate synthase [Planctomycetota bacterium]|nr:adenylosuccinate synthase [Planctomycetota bacterium]